MSPRFPHQQQLIEIRKHLLTRDRLGEVIPVDCRIVIGNPAHHIQHLAQGELVAVDVLRHVLGEFVVNREFLFLLQQKDAGGRELFGDRSDGLWSRDQHRSARRHVSLTGSILVNRLAVFRNRNSDPRRDTLS